MKNVLALILVANLVLAGCAAKKGLNDQAPEEAAPAVSEQAPPVQKEETITPEPVEVAAAVEVKDAETEVAERPAKQIFFDFDSYLITPAGKEILVGNALWLQDQPDLHITIAGHTDERGADSYNLALGENRAQAARAYLLNLGIDPKRIATISYGEEKAIKGAGDESTWAQDRRAEFVMAN